MQPNKLIKSNFALKFDGFTIDHHQRMIVDALNSLANSLIEIEKPSIFQNFKNRIFHLNKKNNVNVKGLYIWGGVGRGKTLLMDQFYETLPVERKLRLHYHRFMVLVHEQRKKLENTQNPMQQVADYFADWASIICLDEMVVTDIVDAMIMDRLLRRLFEKGVVLVITSNFHPDQLYREGLKRALFLPAIERIKVYTDVCELKGNTDYRLRQLENIQTAYVPHDEKAVRGFWKYYNAAIGINLEKPAEIIINERKISVVRWTNGVVWFDFDVICQAPRSTSDYVEIARYFHTVLIQNVAAMDDESSGQARRFINMIDEFYDQRVNFIVSSESNIREIYTGKKLAFEFKRTSSRLKEMQSTTYLRKISPEVMASEEN